MHGSKKSTCCGVGHDWQYNPFGLGFRILISSLPAVMFLLPSALGFSISLAFFPVVLALATRGPSLIHPYVPIRGHDSACTYPQADDSLGLLMWAQKCVCSVHIEGHKDWHLRDLVFADHKSNADLTLSIQFLSSDRPTPTEPWSFTAMSNPIVSKLLPQHWIQWCFMLNNMA